MNEKISLPVIGADEGRGTGLSRRAMVRRLLAGAGAGAVWPLVAQSHPIYKHFHDESILERAEALPKGQEWKPIFLSAQQSETLATLSEDIVPGAAKAQVHRFIDLLLSVDTAENQKKLVTSLSAVDGEARTRFGHDYLALSASEKDALLTAASAGKESEDENHPALRDHFESLKGWISGAYYSSEEGMKELGWTGKPFFDKFPGCEHPEGHN